MREKFNKLMIEIPNVRAVRCRNSVSHFQYRKRNLEAKCAGDWGVGVRTLRLRQVSHGVICACFVKGNLSIGESQRPGDPEIAAARTSAELSGASCDFSTIRGWVCAWGGGGGTSWGIEDIEIAWRVLRGKTSAADGYISAPKLAWTRAGRTISSRGPKEAFIFPGSGTMGVKGA